MTLLSIFQVSLSGGVLEKNLGNLKVQVLLNENRARWIACGQIAGL